MTKNKQLSTELLVYRNLNGIKLVKSTQLNPYYSLGQVLKFPFNIYFLDKTGSTIQMNEQCAENCGFESVIEAQGKSLFAVSRKESAANLINNCRESMHQNQIRIFDEENVRKDGVELRLLSIKSPWYDEANNIIGIFGCSIVLDKHSLAASLMHITSIGLLKPDDPYLNKLEPKLTYQQLSIQERLCVDHLCKGYTIKEIARKIKLSPKTVETYLERAKLKLHSQNKAELISTFLKEF